MTSFKIENQNVIDVPRVEYWPSGKRYGEWLDEIFPEMETQARRPSVQYQVLNRIGQFYVWHDEVKRLEEEAVKAKRVARFKLSERFAELYARRTKEVHDLTHSVEEAIETSRQILDIPQDWDEEGSPAYSEATWLRATRFIKDVAMPFITRYRKHIAPPKITPGPNGSIDIRWKTEKRTMLVNFPADEMAPADFFGHDKTRDTIKGTLDLASQNQWLLLWLTR